MNRGQSTQVYQSMVQLAAICGSRQQRLYKKNVERPQRLYSTRSNL